MDWMDAYLDGLADHTNVVYPPDSHTWRPVKPTKQQQSLIQDSLIGDMVRMRLIQEARQAEVNAGMGGGYDAGSAAKEGPVAPSITVPGAPTITSIGTGNTELSAFFTAPISNGGAAITNYKYSINRGISFTARSPASTSSPIRITGLTNGTEYDVRIRAVNSAGDGTISNALSGTPAAPSGIPVASTASFLILWSGYIYSYNYRTMSRLEPNQTIDIGYASWNSGPNRNYKLESSYQIELIAPGNLSTIGGSAGYLISLDGPKNYWRLIRVSTNCSDGECDTNLEESHNITNFTNPEYFPDTGYPSGFSYTL